MENNKDGHSNCYTFEMVVAVILVYCTLSQNNHFLRMKSDCTVHSMGLDQWQEYSGQFYLVGDGADLDGNVSLPGHVEQ